MKKNIRPKKILILGAGIEQSIVIRLAKKLGYFVIAADANPHAIGLKYADKKVVVDIKDAKKLISIGKKYNIDGVMTHGVEVPVAVARVAQALGLPGLNPIVADRATDKFKRISCFQKKGIVCPRFEIARTRKEALSKSGQIGFPLVIKPVDNSGARGVKKINSFEELENGFAEARLYSSGPVLLEEFLEGDEISTESIIVHNKIFTTGFGDRNYSRQSEFQPYFVEDGHHVPSLLDENKKKEAITIVEKAIKALGINWGVAKGDVLVNKNGVYVLEMAARTSGGWFAAGTVPFATGVNILKPLLQMSVGDAVDENELSPTFQKAACQRYIIPTKDGEFVKLHGIERAKKMPGIKMFDVFNIPPRGAAMRRATHNGERFAHCIAEGKNIREATMRCEKAISKISIILKK
ncbi:MAG: ATP-grasp domain-containing protein [bacterium]|nr:ATP-grasp domain-containing protein [bacterium]